MSDHYGISTQYFVHPYIFFNPHTILINASTKEFTLVNNAFLSFVIAFEHWQRQDSNSVNTKYYYYVQPKSKVRSQQHYNVNDLNKYFKSNILNFIPTLTSI